MASLKQQSLLSVLTPALPHLILLNLNHRRELLIAGLETLCFHWQLSMASYCLLF